MGVALSGGQRHDSVFFKAAMESIRIPQKKGRPKTRPKEVMADKGYDSDKIRKYLRGRGIQSNIPQKSLKKGTKRRKRGPKPKFDKVSYRDRNMVERLIGWLKNCRRLATRYEKNALCFLAMIKVAFIRFILVKYFSDKT